MGVFDGSVKTQRQIADPITDKRVNSVASLILPAINTPTALLYPGSDVSVVHGHQQLQVDQNRMMRIGMNQDVTVGMDENYQVDMSRTMTVMQNYTRSVMMNSLITVTGNYDKNVLSNYVKSITGDSTNNITGSYWKTVSSNYSKSVTGNADNNITGNYNKSIQSAYKKAVTGTATTTVTGDYVKNLQADYSKSITGASSIKVTGTSNENYIGDHSRMYANNHKSYIAGSDNNTTLGSTLDTKVGPKMFGQSGAHHQQHDDSSQESRSSLITSIESLVEKFENKREFTNFGEAYMVTKFEVVSSALELNGLQAELFGKVQGFGIASNEVTVIKEEEGVSKEDFHALEGRVTGLKNSLQAVRSDTAAMHEEIGAVAERIQPVNLFVGVLFGGNQFAM